MERTSRTNHLRTGDGKSGCSGTRSPSHWQACVLSAIRPLPKKHGITSMLFTSLLPEMSLTAKTECSGGLSRGCTRKPLLSETHHPTRGITSRPKCNRSPLSTTHSLNRPPTHLFQTLPPAHTSPIRHTKSRSGTLSPIPRWTHRLPITSHSRA